MKPSRTFKSGQLSGLRAWAAPAIPAPFAHHTWKLSPQPQRPFSFGLVKVKPADIAFTS